MRAGACSGCNEGGLQRQQSSFAPRSRPRFCPAALLVLVPARCSRSNPLTHARTHPSFMLAPSYSPSYPRSCPRTLVHASFAPRSPLVHDLIHPPLYPPPPLVHARTHPRTFVRALAPSFVPSYSRSCPQALVLAAFYLSLTPLHPIYPPALVPVSPCPYGPADPCSFVGPGPL